MIDKQAKSKRSPKQNIPENRNCLRGGAKMGGEFGKKMGLGRDGLELDPPESKNPATGLFWQPTTFVVVRLFSFSNCCHFG